MLHGIFFKIKYNVQYIFIYIINFYVLFFKNKYVIKYVIDIYNNIKRDLLNNAIIILKYRRLQEML